MKWRLLNTGYSTPAFNMALDEASLILLSEKKIEPTLRFYGWDPAAISTGYFQSMDELDVDACRKMGIGIVRRLTGGRAVLHDNELTYSILVPESDDIFPASVLGTYKILSKGILSGLKILGIDADISIPARKGHNSLSSQGESKSKLMKSAACFDAPSWYEIVVNGKKIVGSAQSRKKRVILQHGSIPFSFDVDKFYNLLRFDDPAKKIRMKNIYMKKAASLLDVSGNKYSFEEGIQAFTKGFSQGLDVHLEPGELTEEEMDLVEELMENKYNNDKWTFRR